MQAKQVFSTYSWQEGDDLLHFRYCPFCGTQLVLKEKGGLQRPVCPNCGFVQFRNPSPGAVVVIEEDGQVLVDNIVFGTAAEKAGVDFDWEIVDVLAEADQPPKQLFFIPALALFGLIVLLQLRRRATAAV